MDMKNVERALVEARKQAGPKAEFEALQDVATLLTIRHLTGGEPLDHDFYRWYLGRLIIIHDAIVEERRENGAPYHLKMEPFILMARIQALLNSVPEAIGHKEAHR